MFVNSLRQAFLPERNAHGFDRSPVLLPRKDTKLSKCVIKLGLEGLSENAFNEAS
jgi:hypothetical protein